MGEGRCTGTSYMIPLHHVNKQYMNLRGSSMTKPITIGQIARSLNVMQRNIPGLQWTMVKLTGKL
uniref:Uncharacterized protein n=1 Tax=Oryza brachyantha TaxID=4533 RepID=J3MGJ0_ORYBR